MNSTINGGNHGNRGDDFPPPLRSRAGKPYPTRAESKKENGDGGEEERSRAGFDSLPGWGVVRAMRRRNPHNPRNRKKVGT